MFQYILNHINSGLPYPRPHWKLVKKKKNFKKQLGYLKCGFRFYFNILRTKSRRVSIILSQLVTNELKLVSLFTQNIYSSVTRFHRFKFLCYENTMLWSNLSDTLILASNDTITHRCFERRALSRSHCDHIVTFCCKVTW